MNCIFTIMISLLWFLCRSHAKLFQLLFFISISVCFLHHHHENIHPRKSKNTVSASTRWKRFLTLAYSLSVISFSWGTFVRCCCCCSCCDIAKLKSMKKLRLAIIHRINSYLKMVIFPSIQCDFSFNLLFFGILTLEWLADSLWKCLCKFYFLLLPE